MQTFRLISLLLLALATGCSDKPAPVAATPPTVIAAPAPSNEVLMQAVFGKQYRPATKDALAELPMMEDHKKIRLFFVVPMATSVLASGETVLVARSTYAEELNEEKIEKPDFFDIYVSVYLLRETAGKWTVVKRNPNLMLRGFDEHPGSVLFLKLGKDIPGLALASGRNDEGCFNNEIHLFDLRDDPLRDLTGEGISTGSSMTGSCGATDLIPETETNATWFLAPSKKPSAYSDIVMSFVTKTSATTGDESHPKQPASSKKDSARYAYDGKLYKLVSGDSPIDGLQPDGKPFPHPSGEASN